MSAFSSGSINNYEYLTGEEILHSNENQIIEQAKFTYYSLGNTFKEETEELVKAMKDLNNFDKIYELKKIKGIFPQDVLNDLITNKLENNH